MKKIVFLIAIFSILAFTLILSGCSSKEPMDDSTTQVPKDTILDEKVDSEVDSLLDEELLEDEYIEIGEMI